MLVPSSAHISNESLTTKIEKFNQCLALYSKLKPNNKDRRQLLDEVDALSGIGYAYLLKARASGDPVCQMFSSSHFGGIKETIPYSSEEGIQQSRKASTQR